MPALPTLLKHNYRNCPHGTTSFPLYGDSPKIVGLETCETFRQTISPTRSLLAPAGVFNSGTNLLAELLLKNCVFKERRKKEALEFDGKSIGANINHLGFAILIILIFPLQNNSVIMPVVTIRDPYSWLQSMCRHRYSAHWFHPPNHCPNFIPDERDFEFLQYAEIYKRPKFQKYHHDDPWLVDNVMNTANFNATQTCRFHYMCDTNSSIRLTRPWHIYGMIGIPNISTEIFLESLCEWKIWYFMPRRVIEQVCTCVGGTFAATIFNILRIRPNMEIFMEMTRRTLVGCHDSIWKMVLWQDQDARHDERR